MDSPLASGSFYASESRFCFCSPLMKRKQLDKWRVLWGIELCLLQAAAPVGK